MNQLSWILYLGNVVSNLGPLFVFVGLCLMAVGLCSLACYVEGYTKRLKLSIPMIVMWLLMWLLAALCPSSDTVYAIAASEMGEKALQSQTGTLATQALNAWLKRQITPPVDSSK